jgi:hypothetical protein
MTPYYKAVVDGKNPDPRDWCGVFVSLHEKVSERWCERAYAYNLYRGGEFEDAPTLKIGRSRIDYAAPGTWKLTVQERGLWFEETHIEATFTAQNPPLSLPPMGDKSDDTSHAWVCVAPACQVEAVCTLSNGTRIRFTANGYHDHNFGQLPWDTVDGWYWGRGHRSGETGIAETIVWYALVSPLEKPRSLLFVFDANGNLCSKPEEGCWFPYRDTARQWGRYGFVYPANFSTFAVPSVNNTWFSGECRLTDRWGVFADGPFYRRLPLTVKLTEGAEFSAASNNGTAYEFAPGIGEVFRPARLCGPIASRAIWTRIRRRN